MSLIGIHYAHAARHDRFGEYLKQAADAGSPFAGIFTVDQHIAPDLAKYSPSTTGIFRATLKQHNDAEPRDDAVLGQGEPAQIGALWYAIAEKKFQLNPGYAFYSCTNELNPDNPKDHRWAAAYWLAQMQAADATGRKIVWGNFSAGCPDYPDWATYYADCVRYSATQSHALGLHEYGLGAGTLRTGVAAETVLRYRRVYEIFKQNDLGWPQLAISECAPGANIGNDPTDLDDVKFYDAALMADREAGIPILFAALYQWGGAEAQPFADFMPALSQYVAGHPAPEPPQPPKPKLWRVIEYNPKDNTIFNACSQRAIPYQSIDE
jgi:hypothetical protein